MESTLDEELTAMEADSPELANLFRHILTLPRAERAQCLERMQDWMTMHQAAEIRRVSLDPRGFGDQEDVKKNDC